MREVVDESDHWWRVWEVQPNPGVAPGGVGPPTVPRITVREDFRGGWLVFESLRDGERIRLAPAPPAWRELPDDQLIALRHHGTAVTVRRRLIE